MTAQVVVVEQRFLPGCGLQGVHAGGVERRLDMGERGDWSMEIRRERGDERARRGRERRGRRIAVMGRIFFGIGD